MGCNVMQDQFRTDVQSFQTWNKEIPQAGWPIKLTNLATVNSTTHRGLPRLGQQFFQFYVELTLHTSNGKWVSSIQPSDRR